MSHAKLADQKTKVPRSFRLVESIKLSKEFGYVSYGVIPEDELENKDNYVKLENWQGSIVYDDGNNFHLFSLHMKVPMEYPDRAPIIVFDSGAMESNRIKKICTNDGHIKSEILDKIGWQTKWNLGDYMMEIRKYI